VIKLSEYVFDNAKKCLQCKNSMCSKGCPVNTPIRDAIHLLLNGDIAEAGKIIFENNPLSIICCHVCPQETQCEGNCVLGRKASPVQISAIEKYISDYYLNIYDPVPSKRTKCKVAIIGAGPAGLTIAFSLSKLDYDVTIFERHSNIGGVLRYGIPEFRLPKVHLDRLTKTLRQSGVRIRPNTTIGRNITIEDILNDGHQAVFIGAGVWKPYKMNIKGESLGNVYYAIDYLKKPEAYELGKRVAIIGAGNTAVDVARTAFRNYSQEVTIICRGDESAVTAREVEVRYAKMDGVKFLYNKSATEFTYNGIMLEDTETGEKSLFEADSAVIAIGQGPRNVIIADTEGIGVDDQGLVVVNQGGHTTREGVFASGDAVTGARTVVEAVRHSKHVAETMDKYLQSKFGC